MFLQRFYRLIITNCIRKQVQLGASIKNKNINIKIKQNAETFYSIVYTLVQL